jgi:dGTPase
MVPLSDRLLLASSSLAPFAVPLAGTLGRAEREPDDETRFPFQRDRDRIIHTQAFRRLQGKTQVFVTGEEGDHVRTRLTHTMEVAQIGRDIARTLQLNEDLAECIALAHDLGHPPFGHRGEETLNEWLKPHGLRFEHNEQSLRIVTLLETHSPQQQGLNLNREVLEGLQKHREVWTSEPHPRALTLEAQAVDAADEIAYLGHDCDDGLRAGLFTMNDLLSLSLVREAHERTRERGTHLRGGVIHLLVTDLYAETERRLKHANIGSLSDVEHATERFVEFSDTMRIRANELRAFLWVHMYNHPRIVESSATGQEIIRQLCDHLLAEPNEKILALRERTKSALPEAVKDYVAGMTDSFAKEQATAIVR